MFDYFSFPLLLLFLILQFLILQFLLLQFLMTIILQLYVETYITLFSFLITNISI
jgi:hypothetical protein